MTWVIESSDNKMHPYLSNIEEATFRDSTSMTDISNGGKAEYIESRLWVNTVLIEASDKQVIDS